MYFIVNGKMEKPILCCCFTWIVFIELNFTVPFLLIRKTWDDRFAGKVQGWGVLKMEEVADPSNGGGDFEMGGGVDTPLRTMPDASEESRFVMTFLNILGVTEILCSFRLVLEGKTGKEVPESSRLEFFEKF